MLSAIRASSTVRFFPLVPISIPERGAASEEIPPPKELQKTPSWTTPAFAGPAFFVRMVGFLQRLSPVFLSSLVLVSDLRRI